jgi:CRP/FNR family transcriptional regulator, cyclic AMP receptor protein
MNSPNQDKTGYSTIYDPNAALKFFKLFGKFELAKQGKKLFVQGQQKGIFSFFQADKMYLLVEGNVVIQTACGDISDLEPGNIFGELTHYTRHNATAIAKIPCKLFSLTEKQLMAGLKKKPEFLFMLMDVLVNYFQNISPKTKDTSLPTDKPPKKHDVLNAKMLNELKQRLGNEALTIIPEKKTVFQQGASALVMYVILEGYMTISVDDKIVARSGPGDIVGEIALVAKRHLRTANVIAETRCSLLAISRQEILMLTQALPAFGIAILRALLSR